MLLYLLLMYSKPNVIIGLIYEILLAFNSRSVHGEEVICYDLRYNGKHFLIIEHSCQQKQNLRSKYKFTTDSDYSSYTPIKQIIVF